jgi:hypothetical protein
MRRGREEELESGVRGTQFEESPFRDSALDKPKKSLAQFQFGLIKTDILTSDLNKPESYPPPAALK